jgi:hypothetical protein
MANIFVWWRANVIKPIHNAKVPLPPLFGMHASTYMQFLYPLPVFIFGYFSMTWAIEQSHKNIGIRGEKLREMKDLNHNTVDCQNAVFDRVLKRATQKD